MARILAGEVVVFGTDHEDFGSNEHPTDNIRKLDKLMFDGQGLIQIPVAPVRWGGECRVEVDVVVELIAEADNTIRVSGNTRFFEGASENTTELEDAKGFEFFVGRTLNNAPPTVYQVDLRNSTVIGAEDHAEIRFTLTNRMAETE
jgi:hypothetical protein